MLHNNGFVAVSITMVTAKRKRYYGYGSVIDKRVLEAISSVLKAEEFRRVIKSCVLKRK
jgi:hypothetical protein